VPLEIALKVDVCNRRALEHGVPGLLRVLAEFNVRATFFVAFGPDNSGKAIRRIFRPGFLQKMIRTRAPSTYGFKTLLYGTLLPAPSVGESKPLLLKELESAGHEVGLHGWDHVDWHDRLIRMTQEEVRTSCSRAVQSFHHSLGHTPRFTGAPGWQVSPSSLRVQDEMGFAFASDCRGGRPFYPRVDGVTLRTLQIPTTLPTSDELLGTDEVKKDRGLEIYYLDRIHEDGVNVLGVHAEIEGIRYSEWLRKFLARSRQNGAQFPLLSEIARRNLTTAPASEVVRREIPGRTGTVACQNGTV
jgi:undecaprenyl phosphate-alpha-L-ara4FN deformylase